MKGSVQPDLPPCKSTIPLGGHDVERQRLVARVDDIDRLVQVRHCQNGQDGSEDLLLHHRVFPRDVGNDGELDEKVIPVESRLPLIHPKK